MAPRPTEVELAILAVRGSASGSALARGPLQRRIRRWLRHSKRRKPPRMAYAFALLLALGTAVCVALAIRHVGSPRSGTTISISWLPKRVRAFEPQIVAAATRHGLDPDLLAIIVMIESSGDPNARSPVGAAGLMQVMPATATDIARARGLPTEAATLALEDPAHNLDFGAWYFAQQLRRFADHGDSAVELAAAAYNGGPARVQAFLQGRAQLSEETVRYRELVRALWNERTLARSPTLERVRGL